MGGTHPPRPHRAAGAGLARARHDIQPSLLARHVRVQTQALLLQQGRHLGRGQHAVCLGDALAGAFALWGGKGYCGSG